MPTPKENAGEFAGNARFRIVRRIGAGGIGLVYEAVDREYGANVALKTLQRLDAEALLRFKNEFRLLQGIHHENLVQLGELFEEGGHWFFTMELLDGVDFMSHVVAGQPRKPSGRAITQTTAPATATMRPSRRRRDAHHAASTRPPGRTDHRFDEVRLRAALHQLAEGLHALHGAGMVHRDIKPHNVMVCQQRVVLLDFGLVSEEQPWHRYESEQELVLGTPSYMAPEQAAGKPATPASDWYAVGTMLYESLTGTRPFEGQVPHLLMEKQRREPVLPSLRVAHAGSVPPDLEDLCIALLARAPADRPTGAEVLTRVAGAVPIEITSSASTAVIDLSAELVGRGRELAALRDALARCALGRPVTALVHGTSGMGKTALVERFAREARDQDGALVLRGRCYEREAVPFKAFDGVVDELSRYLKHLLGDVEDDLPYRDDDDDDDDALPHGGGAGTLASSDYDSGKTVPAWDFYEGLMIEPDANLDALVASELPVMARLFPVLARVLSTAEDDTAGTGALGTPGDDIRDPGELRRRAFGALKALLALVASRRPLVVIIDDLQWGDLDSAALLSELLAPPDAPGLLLVASFRSEEANSPLVASLRESAHRALGRTGIRDIDVGPLSEAECRALARALWQQLEPDAPVTDARREHIVARAARESSGSPLFVGEMIRYLATASQRGSGEIRDDVTLDRVLRERRRQLDPAARTLLDVVAVAGRPIAQGLALRAAGLDGAERGALAVLRAGHFVRTRGPGLRDAVETYHDRIREAVLAQMDEAALRGHHARLATALENWGSDDAEMLAEHHLGAGRHLRAAEYAMQAAEHAERALAFDRAARMYRLVLEAQPSEDPDRRVLLIRLGTALANASRGLEAADAYLEAAAIAPPVLASGRGAAGSVAPAIEDKRRAAEQLLCSGNIDRGRALLGEALQAAGLRVPRSRKGVLLSLLLRRVQLRLRGLRYQRRSTADISPRERQRTAICWTGAVGLSVVDLLRGADYAARCLLLALRQGDEERIALAMALEACHNAYGGGNTARRAVDLTRVATRIARRVSDPLAQGIIAFAPGAIALYTGRWRQARTRLDRAEHIFTEQCTGVAWELATVRMHQYLALYYLGEWKTLGKRATIAIHQALERSDRFAAAILAYFAAHGNLCMGDVDGARRVLRMAAVNWTTRDYHLQHYYQLRGAVQIELYSGNSEAAWAHLAAALPALRRSLLTRVQLTRMEVAHMHARCALARVAATAPDPGRAARRQTRRLLRIALREARRLEREGVHYCTALATLVRAGAAACQGDRARALALLGQATVQLDKADLGMLCAAARWQQGRLAGGEPGRAAVDQAEQAMRAKGAADPAAIAHTLAPGFTHFTRQLEGA